MQAWSLAFEELRFESVLRTSSQEVLLKDFLRPKQRSDFESATNKIQQRRPRQDARYFQSAVSESRLVFHSPIKIDGWHGLSYTKILKMQNSAQTRSYSQNLGDSCLKNRIFQRSNTTESLEKEYSCFPAYLMSPEWTKPRQYAETQCLSVCFDKTVLI